MAKDPTGINQKHSDDEFKKHHKELLDNISDLPISVTPKLISSM